MSHMRLVPGPFEKSSEQGPRVIQMGANTEYGTHDMLRFGLKTVRGDVEPGHPLESHLDQWEKTREMTKYAMLRNTYGVHAPIRLQMEKTLVSQTLRKNPLLPSKNLAMDILNGKDDQIDVEDVFQDIHITSNVVEPHIAMAHAHGML